MGFIIENGLLRKFIPSDTADIVIPEGVTCIGKRVFEFCRYLHSVKIPDSVTSIEECAFLDCNNLTTMEIPNSVIKIEDYAFCCCELQSITLPNSITHIGNGAFSNTKIIFNQKNFQIYLFLNEGWGINGYEKNLARFYNYPTSDNFKRIEPIGYKYPLALLRFFGHHEDEYRGYIKRNNIKIISNLIDESNYELINIILSERFVTKYGIDKLINYAVEKEQTEITALLLDYKNKHFGFTDINNRFKL